MNYTQIINAVAIMAGLGLVFGIILSYAAKIFYVETDPRIDEVREALPGANCGACGQAGCDAYAAAVVEGKVELTLCTPGGESTAQNIGRIMGVQVGLVSSRKVAVVRCNGDRSKAGEKYNYVGIDSCMAAAQVFNGQKACDFGCLGKADCQRACPFGAIDMINGLAVISPVRCRGCEKCVAACPKKLIAMQDPAKRFSVRCRNPLPGAFSRKVCTVSCIGCTKCVKACPENTISMESSVAVINPDGCVNCGACVEVCPTNAIIEQFVKETVIPGSKEDKAVASA